MPPNVRGEHLETRCAALVQQCDQLSKVLFQVLYPAVHLVFVKGTSDVKGPRAVPGDRDDCVALDPAAALQRC